MPSTSRLADDDLGLDASAPLRSRVLIAWRALWTLAATPNDPIAAQRLNLSLDREVYERLAVELAGTEEGRALLDARPSLDRAALDVEALGQMPEGTLGRGLFHYFQDNHLGPFESTFPVRNAVEYLSKRYRETHDLAHVLTGYGTDVVGEMEVQAFMLGNLGIPTAALIVLFGTLHAVPASGEPLFRYARRIARAVRRGRAARRLLAQPYERWWSHTTDAVRGRVEISPLPDDYVAGRPHAAYLAGRPIVEARGAA